jgi:chromate transport protein ChrA
VIPINEPELSLMDRLVFLLWAVLIAMLASLARQLTEHQSIKFLPLMGGILGSGLASFSFAALMIEIFQVSNLLVLAMAGPIGWLGGDILASLGRRYLQQIDRGAE